MTRKEKINTLKAIIQECEEYQWQRKETLFEIIKDLEQEPILDKIRAEIQGIAFDWQEIDGEHESFMVVDLNDALNIIDKYKAESEPQESEE